jgi:hypothetical protein
MAKTILIPLDKETFLHADHLETAKKIIRGHCEQHGRITLAAREGDARVCVIPAER